jgi:KilA-N domain.
MSTPTHPHYSSQEFINSLNVDQFVSNHQIVGPIVHQQKPYPESQSLAGYPQYRSKHYTFGDSYTGQANSQINELLISPEYGFSPLMQTTSHGNVFKIKQANSHPGDFQTVSYHNGFGSQDYPQLAPQVEFQEKPNREYHSPTNSTDSCLSIKLRNTHSRTSSSGTSHSEIYPDVVKPKVATTFWEDENTVCYQVRCRGILVSRREDTDFINGTKLLNVIGMTRGRRDGILKTEKTRDVIKVGSMNLKGVWIPFNRAYEIARNEGIDEVLFPLFVKDIRSHFHKEGFKLKNPKGSRPPQMGSGPPPMVSMKAVGNTPQSKEGMSMISLIPELLSLCKVEDNSSEPYSNMFR